MNDVAYVVCLEGDDPSVIQESEISDYEDVVADGYAQVLCINWLTKKVVFLTMEENERVWEPVN